MLSSTKKEEKQPGLNTGTSVPTARADWYMMLIKNRDNDAYAYDFILCHNLY